MSPLGKSASSRTDEARRTEYGSEHGSGQVSSALHGIDMRGCPGVHVVVNDAWRDVLAALRLRLGRRSRIVWVPETRTTSSLAGWFLMKLAHGVVVETQSQAETLPGSVWDVIKKVSFVFPAPLQPRSSREASSTEIVSLTPDGSRSAPWTIGDRKVREISVPSDPNDRRACLRSEFLASATRGSLWCDPHGVLDVGWLLSLMGAGVIVAAAESDRSRTVIEDGVSGLLISTGADARIADELASIQDTPEAGARMSEQARLRAERLSSPTAREAQWKAFHQRLVGTAPRIVRIGTSKTLWTIQANQIRHQREHGADIVLVADSDEFRDRLLSLGCPVVDAGQSRRPGPVELIRFSLTMALALRGRGIIVHTHNVPASVTVRLASFLGRRPFSTIETFHNLNDLLSESVQARASRSILRFTKRNVDASLSITDTYDRSIVSKGLVREGATEVIGTGLDLERFREMRDSAPSPETLLAGIGAHAGEKVIVCIARFDPQKGHPILFRAFSKLLIAGRSGLRLVLLGVGPTEPELRQLAQELGIADHVSFLGQRDDVPQILTVADLVVLASGHEGFGRCIVEGLASRIPVVSTDTDGPRLILSGAEKAWLTAHDDDALSAAIDEALDGLSEDVLDANEAYVARFDEVRIASRMLEIYRDVHGAEAPPVTTVETGDVDR